MELAHTGVADDFRQGQAQLRQAEGERCSQVRIELHQAAEVHGRAGRAVERADIRASGRMGQLTGPVGPEVEEDNGITWPDGGERFTVRARNHRRADELIGLAALIGGLHRLRATLRTVLRLSADDRAVSLPRPLPALVAVHRVVAAADAGDLRADAQVAAGGIELAQRRQAPVGSGVAAVRERVHRNPADLLLLRESQQGEQVLQAGMNPAVTDQAEQMDGPVRPGLSHALLQDGVAEELTGADLLVDVRQALQHDPARTDVEVTDFGVADLTFGQADSET